MPLTAIKSLDTAFTAVQECFLPDFLLNRGKCMLTVKSLVSASLGCLCTRLRRNIFLQLAVIRWLFVLKSKNRKPYPVYLQRAKCIVIVWHWTVLAVDEMKFPIWKKFKFVFSASEPLVPGKMAALRADNRWQRACGLLAGFSFPGSLLRFGAQPLTSRKLLTTINALKEIELRKNFTMVRKSMYPSPWQNSFFNINFKRSRTG